MRIRPAVDADLGWMHRFGSALHVEHCRRDFARDGVLMLVAVDDETGEPVGKLHIDLEEEAGAGVIGAVAVMEERQGRGVGTALMAAAEQVLVRRGIDVAELGVEDTNPRARQLYERLGYRVVGRAEFSYERVDAGGVPVLTHNPGVVMRKELHPNEL